MPTERIAIRRVREMLRLKQEGLPRVNQDWNPRQSGQEWPPRFPFRAGGARPEGKPRRLREPF